MEVKARLCRDLDEFPLDNQSRAAKLNSVRLRLTDHDAEHAFASRPFRDYRCVHKRKKDNDTRGRSLWLPVQIPSTKR
jgi:hypothetical protein